MKDSFVIHSEYIEDLPEENKPEYLMYIYNYGCKGIEPELTGLALTVWIKIKRRIDEDEEAYNKKLKGNSTGGKKHTGNQYTRVNNGSQWKSMEVNGSRGSESVSVYDNEFVSVHEGEREPETASEKPSAPPDYSLLQKKLFSLITEHNNSVSVESRIPISNNEISFAQKESREILEVMRGSTPEEIIHTVENLLKSAKERRKKKYSWYWFLQDINEYKPGFFIDDTKPDKEPLTVDSFCQLMMGKPGFNLSAFLSNQSKWLEAGCPQGDSYFALQKTWEVGNAAS